MTAMTFEELGSVLWARTRENDELVLRILDYYTKDVDQATVVANDCLGFNPLFEGAYHALVGLGMLQPYIDDGYECARLTPFGREIYGRLKA